MPFQKGHKINMGVKQSAEHVRKRTRAVSASLKKYYANGGVNPMKGKTLSEESRRKISEAKKGNAPWMKGRKHSAESIEKMRVAHSGKKQTPEQVEKRVAHFRGKLHFAWKGRKASSDAIHKWIVSRLGKPSICENCGTRNALKFEWANVDHSYRRKLDDWMRLCTSCHRKHDQTWLKRERDINGRFA